MSYSCPPKPFVQKTNYFFLNLPLLFNASDNPRDENTIKVGAKRHIANILRTKDVVTLEKNESLNQFNTEIVLTAKHPTCKWLSY